MWSLVTMDWGDHIGGYLTSISGMSPIIIQIGDWDAGTRAGYRESLSQ